MSCRELISECIRKEALHNRTATHPVLVFWVRRVFDLVVYGLLCM